MEYETVVMISQITALLFFIALFLAIVIYVFWPGNKKKFDEASRLPFENDEPDAGNGRG
ncbi:MAG: cbb3-type cytochrome c oxidase subunit 3 [Hyphomicrobiaceae bacterium]|nr:cbb3-type cytochrome c oxidase subunit 3 [Hyphomicrobiaceae bacterium]